VRNVLTFPRSGIEAMSRSRITSSSYRWNRAWRGVLNWEGQSPI